MNHQHPNLQGGGMGIAASSVPLEIQNNLALVHRILLTDATNFASLTISGHPPLLETPPYDAFVSSLELATTTQNTTSHHERGDASTLMNINAMVKGAFRDKLCESIARKHDWSEAVDLLCELHMFIRNLVPSRKELHDYLDDQEARRAPNLMALRAVVVKAAAALQALEAPARSESTGAWVRQFWQMDCSTDEFSMDSIKMLVNGLLYLLFKTELCETDKQNYFLAAVWAPILQSEGPKLEQKAFEKDYGSMKEPSTAPATRDWINSLVDKLTDAEVSALLVSKSLRWNLIRTGWIEEILFRPADSSALQIPEILARDAGRLQGLRHVTRMAAAGSALALLACQAAEQPMEVLEESEAEDDESSIINRKRKVLVQVMAEHFKSPVNYEQDIGNAVIAIAKIWKPDLCGQGVEGLLHRAKNVLKAEDPVIQLLDGRMKDCFRELMVQVPTETALPTHMQSGAVARNVTQPLPHDKNTFVQKGISLFKKRGLAFYASDLSNAAHYASRVIDLALKLYGDAMIDGMVLDACQKKLPAHGV
eukprot:scaffold3240_cov187-Amphora_coffeaeformis.AAC.20